MTFPALESSPPPQGGRQGAGREAGTEGSGRDSLQRAQLALPLLAGGNPSVSGAHLFTYSQGIPLGYLPTFRGRAASSGNRGRSTARTGGARPQLGAEVQQRLVDHPKCKKFKNQQLLPGQDWLCQREWQQEALGSGSWRGCARCGLVPAAVPAHPRRCSFPFAAASWSSSLLYCGRSHSLFPGKQVWIFPRKLAAPLEVREAAGILLVVVGNGEDGVVELVVTELLERHSGRDGGEHRDV